MASFRKDTNKTVEFSNDNRTCTRTAKYEFDTIYGTEWMDPKQNTHYKYILNIDVVEDYIWIGIADKDDIKTPTNYGPYEKKGYGAISCHTNGGEFFRIKESKYGGKKHCHIKSGDIIELDINFTDLSLIYSVNGKIICKDEIENVPYKLAITLGEINGKITIYDFQILDEISSIDDKKDNEITVKIEQLQVRFVCVCFDCVQCIFLIKGKK